MRWTPVLLAAATAFAPLGCVEPDTAAKPSTKTTAGDTQPPPAPKPTDQPRKTDSPPPPDDTDPVVKAAHLSGERVARHEERIDEALTAVSADLETLAGTDFRAVDQTAEKLLATVQLLRASGERILKRYPQVKADLAGIVKANGGVKVGYGRARELYREKAEVETGDLKERYLALADLCDAFLRTSDERTAHYAAFAKDLDKAVAKVERHIQFLGDFEAFLKLHPPTHGAKEREQFIGTLNTFAEQVLKFGEVLKAFRDKVRDGAVSLKLRGEHEKAVAAAARAENERATEPPPAVVVTRKDPEPPPAREVPPPPNPVATEARMVSVSPVLPTTPTSALTTVGVPVGTSCQPPSRCVPVATFRCVPTLVPVTCHCTQRGPFGGCRTVAVTQYEWRNQLVTETRLAVVHP